MNPNELRRMEENTLESVRPVGQDSSQIFIFVATLLNESEKLTPIVKGLV